MNESCHNRTTASQFVTALTENPVYALERLMNKQLVKFVIVVQNIAI